MTNGKITCLEFEKNITSPNHEYIFSSTRNGGKSCSGILRGYVESTKPEGLVKSTQTAYFMYREVGTQVNKKSSFLVHFGSFFDLVIPTFNFTSNPVQVPCSALFGSD